MRYGSASPTSLQFANVAKLDDDSHVPGSSYLSQFQQTHFYTLVTGGAADRSFGTLSERDSQRAQDARAWYKAVIGAPNLLHKRIAKCLSAIGYPAKHEQEIKTEHSRVVADVLAERSVGHQRKVIVEVKVFSSSQTTPSNIRDEIRRTLKKYAQLAGYIQRQ